MANDQLEWRRINQFKGLWQQDPIAAPEGAATQMMSCYPSAGVGIIPAWRNEAVNAVGNGAGDIAAANMLPAGLHLVLPIQRGGEWADWETDLWVGVTPNNNLPNLKVFRMKSLKGPAVAPNGNWQKIIDVTPAGITKRNHVLFENFRAYGGALNNKLIVAVSWHPKKYFWPDRAAPGTDSAPETFYTHTRPGGGPDAFCMHQGRLIWNEPLLYDHGAGGSKIVDINVMRYTHWSMDAQQNPQDVVKPPEGASEVQAFMMQGANPSPVVAIASADVDDLFILKMDGAYLAQGDLATSGSRRIVRLANVPGSHAQKLGVTPWGIAYGVYKGPVVLWQGGPGVQSLSDELKPGFWDGREANGIFSGYIVSSGNQFLFTPNGYVWDSRTQAWFQHADLVNGASKFFCWDPYNGFLYWLGKDNGTQIGRFSPNDEQGTNRVTTWTWESAPIVGDSYRPLEVREVQIFVKTWNLVDSCTFAVTIGGVTKQVTVAPSADIQMRRLQFHSHQVKAMTVKVVATSAGSAGVMRELRIGYRAGTQVGASD